MKEYRSLNEQLRELHALAKEARDTANCAYTIALKNKQEDYDTRDAFRTVMRTNELMERIYEMTARYI
jgi:hypothetical protein